MENKIPFKTVHILTCREEDILVRKGCGFMLANAIKHIIRILDIEYTVVNDKHSTDKQITDIKKYCFHRMYEEIKEMLKAIAGFAEDKDRLDIYVVGGWHKKEEARG